MLKKCHRVFKCCFWFLICGVSFFLEINIRVQNNRLDLLFLDPQVGRHSLVTLAGSCNKSALGWKIGTNEDRFCLELFSLKVSNEPANSTTNVRLRYRSVETFSDASPYPKRSGQSTHHEESVQTDQVRTSLIGCEARRRMFICHDSRNFFLNHHHLLFFFTESSNSCRQSSEWYLNFQRGHFAEFCG